jgi:ATP/maltotriose-dependent transcriptional regulator MalT
MQVQRDQQDAQQFWLALLGAVRRASGTTSGAEPPAVTPEFNGRAMVDRVLSELEDHPGRGVLVIDDLHELRSRDALVQLTRLLTHLPPNAHAVLATRRDLRLRLHQLRLAGELAEIRAEDLRFTERETCELLGASGITLSEAGAALLHQRTEGWAAGVRLAAISLAGHPDPERFVAEFSGSERIVAEYLVAEMLERQPEDVQQVLLRTSLLDRVNGELADLLTGRPGSERILLSLEDANAYGWGAEPMTAPALITLASTMVWTGEFDQAEGWLQRAMRALQADTGADIRLLVHIVNGMLRACRGHHHEALQEFSAAEHLGSRLADSHALASQVTGWMLAAQARLGMPGEARAAIGALADERVGSSEIHNARAAICLAERDPAGALGALRDVLDGTAPVVGYVTVVEAQLLAGLAYRELGDLRAGNQAAERALALAESDRLVLPFAMTGSRELLEALPRHETAHAALLADILDALHGSAPAAEDQPPPPDAEELSPGELRVLRYLPTNLSRPEIAGELSVSPNTVSTHIRSIYAKLGVRDRSSAVQRARELQLLSADRAH